MSNSIQTSAGSRIATLLDESSFAEIGAYITARSIDFNMTEQETPADGVATGYGTIGGYLVYVYSQDASVLGGSMGEMHAEKIYNIYSMAMKMGVPVIGLVDCAGLRLQEAIDTLNGSDKLYLNQTMASDVIPQIVAIFGACGGSMAVSVGIVDFTSMEEKSGKLLVSLPNAIDGNYKEKCGTSSADLQSRGSGLADFAGDEDSVIAQIRALVSILPASNEDNMSYKECQDDLNRICDDIEGRIGDTALALTLISDNSFSMGVKKDYEPSMVTGFIRLNGTAIGCVANRMRIYGNGEKKETPESALLGGGYDKAADFTNFYDAFNISVLALVSVKGYKAKMCSEGRIVKTAARPTYTYASAGALKVTVIIKEASGNAHLIMGSKSIGTDIVYTWPDAVIGMINSSEVVKTMCTREVVVSGNTAALINEKTAEYTALQSSAVAAAKRGHVGNIIKAEETHQRVVVAFEMLFAKGEDRSSKRHGTV